MLLDVDPGASWDQKQLPENTKREDHRVIVSTTRYYGIREIVLGLASNSTIARQETMTPHERNAR